MNHIHVSIIVPTYNEAENIEPLIREIFLALPRQSTEIIIVDDDSPDGTWRVARALHMKQVRVFRRMRTRGLTSAIQFGIDHARGLIVGWLDADLSHQPKYFTKMLQMMKKSDVVVASRYVRGARDDRKEKTAVVMSRIINWIARTLLYRTVTDYTSGFILIKKRIFEDYRLQGDYGEYFIRLLSYCVRHEYPIHEIPYVFVSRVHGVSKTAVSLGDFFVKGIKYVKAIMQNTFGNIVYSMSLRHVFARRSIRELPYILMVCIGCSAIVIILVLKMQQSFYVPAWDQSHHLIIAYQFYSAMKEGGVAQLVTAILQSQTIYPPLYHLFVAFGYMIFGVQPTIGILIQILFIYISGFSLYKLARIVVGSLEAALVSILSLCVPCIVWLYSDALTDFMSVTLFVLSFLFLLKSNYFQNRKFSVIFGLTVLANILTRWTFVIAAVPFFWYVIDSLRKAETKSRVIENVLLVFFISIPSLFWYIPHWQLIQESYTFFSNPENIAVRAWNLPVGFTWRTLLYYPKAAIGFTGIGIVPLICFVISAFYALGKRLSKPVYYILGSIVCVLVFQTILQDKTPKYIAYIYPFVLVSFFAFCTEIKNGRIKYFLITVFSVSLLVNFVFAYLTFPAKKTVDIQISSYRVPILAGIDHSFEPVLWPSEQIITDNFSNLSTSKTLLVLSDYKYLNHVTFQYYADKHYIPLIAVQALYLYDPMNPQLDFAALEQYDFQGSGFDYVFTKSGGDMGVLIDHDTTVRINEYLQTFRPNWPVVTYDLPDDSKGMLYTIVK
ncbi:MAG: glycosyltransferase [Microgenomates group bacterium]